MQYFNLFDNQRRSNDDQYIDMILSEWFQVSGPSIFVHLFIGSYGSVDEDGNPIDTSVAGAVSPVVPQIQDVVLMENRDRMYDPYVREIHGVFQIPDYEFSLSQFGLFLSGDSLTVEVHINDMLAICGRKIMAGDVLEFPNFRDEVLLNQPGKAANKFYVVSEAKRAPSGYQATWFPHIWRIKCDPMKASQEFADILSQPSQNPFGIDDGSTLAALISTAAADLGINEQIVQEAEAIFLRRNFETRHYYIVPGDEKQSAWIFTGDGIPPNGAVLSATGGNWPDNPQQGDFFLRTDMRPNQLFLYRGAGWHLQELDYRQVWTGAGRLLMEKINNRDISTFDDGTTQPSRQNLWQAVMPTADYGKDNPHPGDAQDFPMFPPRT